MCSGPTEIRCGSAAATHPAVSAAVTLGCAVETAAGGADSALRAKCPFCSTLTVQPVPPTGKVAHLKCHKCERMFGIRIPRAVLASRPASGRVWIGSLARV